MRSNSARRLAEAGANCWFERSTKILRAVRQNAAEATLAPILKKEDGLIDWSWPAEKIFNRARGFLPWPGALQLSSAASCFISGKRVWLQVQPPGDPGRLVCAIRAPAGGLRRADRARSRSRCRSKAASACPAEAFLNGVRLAKMNF